MKLSMKTYLVSVQLPKKDVEDDHDSWPTHTRVRASTATRAIVQVQRELRQRFNAYTAAELGELRYESNEGVPFSFSNRDFPIIEVKVVG